MIFENKAVLGAFHDVRAACVIPRSWSDLAWGFLVRAVRPEEKRFAPAIPPFRLPIGRVRVRICSIRVAKSAKCRGGYICIQTPRDLLPFLKKSHWVAVKEHANMKRKRRLEWNRENFAEHRLECRTLKPAESGLENRADRAANRPNSTRPFPVPSSTAPWRWLASSPNAPNTSHSIDPPESRWARLRSRSCSKSKSISRSTVSGPGRQWRCRKACCPVGRQCRKRTFCTSVRRSAGGVRCFWLLRRFRQAMPIGCRVLG